MENFLKLPKKHSKQSITFNTEEEEIHHTEQQVFPHAQNIPLLPNQMLKERLNFEKPLSMEQHRELSYILLHILNLPSLDEAETHRSANRLGNFDIHERKEKSRKSRKSNKREFCKCCGFAKQEESIPICTSFDNFPNVGLTAYLFFQTIKNLLLLMLFLIIFFAFYSFFSNCYLTGFFDKAFSFEIGEVLSYLNAISLKTKKFDVNAQKQKMYLIQLWVIMAVVLIWSLLLFLIRYFERKSELMVDEQTISASDFSILIENYPKSLTQAELQQQLTSYEHYLRQITDLQIVNPFTIEKMNLNRNLAISGEDNEKMEEINRKIRDKKMQVRDYVGFLRENGGFPGKREKRIEKYQQICQLEEERKRLGKGIISAMFENIGVNGNNKNSNPFAMFASLNAHGEQPDEKINPTTDQEEQKGKSIAIVTFKSSTSKDVISKLNSMNISEKIRYYLSCCPKKTRLILKNPREKYQEYQESIIICKAPEPEDLIWQNLEIPEWQKIMRKVMTYLVSLLLLAASLACVYLLSKKQMQNNHNSYLSILISLSISVINFLIGFLIRLLTIFEKHYTWTGYQTSIALKSILAQVLNTILVPIIANYLLENRNIYHNSNGLAVDVFYLCIINALLPPLLKIIDPYYRFLMLRGHCAKTSVEEQFFMSQNQINDSQELMEFQIGYEYIYYINLYLFTAFFITLQPIIVLFSFLGTLLMYWVHKWTLLHRSKRPIPGTDLISTAMGQAINLGPLFFALGALTWSHFLDDGSEIKQTIFSFILNIISGGLALFFLLFPFSLLFQKCLSHQTEENLDYEESRIFLSSEYDRMNPATMREAIQEYEQYIENYMRKNKGDLKNKQHKNIDERDVNQNFIFDDIEQDGHSGMQIVETLENQPFDQEKKISKYSKIDESFWERKKNQIYHKAGEGMVRGMIGEFGLGEEILKGLFHLTKGKEEENINKKEEKKTQSQSEDLKKEQAIKIRPNYRENNIKSSNNNNYEYSKTERKQSPRNLEYMKHFGTKNNLVFNEFYADAIKQRKPRLRKNPYEDTFQW